MRLMAITFHAGNREVQDEANSRPVADLLASRSKGPEDALPDPMRAADIVLLAMAHQDGSLRFQAVSGPAAAARRDLGRNQVPRGHRATIAQHPRRRSGD